MIARLPLALALASALVHVASAQLQVLSPGGDNLWWGEFHVLSSISAHNDLFAVADNENLLVWNCNESQEQTFTVLYVSFLSLESPSFFLNRVNNPNMASALAM